MSSLPENYQKTKEEIKNDYLDILYWQGKEEEEEIRLSYLLNHQIEKYKQILIK